MPDASAPGKIILTGEYAVVFGYPGIAIPAPIGMEVSYTGGKKDLKVVWKGIEGNEQWIAYAMQAAELCGTTTGTLTVKNDLPLGKGMGSSTALIIAITRCLLGDDEKKALEIEDAMNPGHSGIDFGVIWGGKPVRFVKDESIDPIKLPKTLLKNAVLIDTGTPEERTPELIAWVASRREDDAVSAALEEIGECTRRLEAGDKLPEILRSHHRAQVALGVVLPEVQELVARIEESGGAAKVLGAGAKSGGPAGRSPKDEGGGGIVLALHKNPKKLKDLIPDSFTMLPL